MNPRRLAIILVCTQLTACVINSEKWPRPRDLNQAWMVDRTRVLAIRAEPPEITPGETATFSALIPSPGAEDPAIVWLACPPAEEGGVGFGCNLDLGAVDFENADPAELAELGFIGFEPFIPPVYTAPLDTLDGVEDPGDRREGVNILVQITAMPPEVLEQQVDDLDFNEVEVGYKRLIVSEASTPNRNPVIASFTVDGTPVDPKALVHVEPNQRYELGAELTTSSVETYEYLNSDGELEQRTEEPYVSWYTTAGTVEEPFTLVPFLQSDFVTPERPGTSGTWFAVARDRRGGMAWWVQDFVVD